MAFDHIATKGAIHISFETTKVTEAAINHLPVASG